MSSSSLQSGVAGFIMGTILSGGNPVVGLVLAIVAVISTEFQLAQIKKPEEEKVGFKVNTMDTQEVIRVVYGKQIVGGNDVFRHTTGEDNKDLWIVQTLAEGPCASLGTIYLGDQQPEDFAAEGASNVSYWFKDGASNATVCGALNTAVEDYTDPLRYTAHIVWKLTYDRNYFMNVPRRTGILKGKKIYDFRNDVTQWTDNPVLCLYDYMTNGMYGFGEDSANIDEDSWSAAATYASDKGWKLNLIISHQQAANDIIANICMHFRGTLVWFGGKWYLRCADTTEEISAKTIEDANIVQTESGAAIVQVVQNSAFNKPDGLIIQYLNAENNYTIDSVPIGERVGEIQELPLLGCTDRNMAFELGNYYLERARLNRTILIRGSEDCIELEPHDVVTFNSTSLAIEDQLMRVVEANILSDNLVDLTLQYESDDLYNEVYDVNIDQQYATTLPDPKLVPPNVENMLVTEQTYFYRLRTLSRLEVTFDAPSNYAWFDYAEVWIRRGDPENSWEHQSNTEGRFFLETVQEDESYTILLRSVNIWGVKRPLEDCVKKIQLVGGVTSSPQNITTLNAVVNANTVNLFSTKLDDPDVEIYEFRLGSSWSGGIFMASLRSPNLSLYGVKPGSHTFWCATKGTGGQYADGPVSATAALVEPPDGWLVQDTDTCDYDGVGTHDNTEHTIYDTDDYLKCSHTAGVLTGTYKSPTFDLGASGTYLIYIMADVVVVGTGTTWDDQLPLVLTGGDLFTDGSFASWTGDDLDSWTEHNCDAAEDVSGEIGSAAQITASADDAYIYQDVAVTAEKWYRLDFYYKNTTSDVAVFGVYDNSNSKWLSPDGLLNLTDNTTDFIASSYLFYAPTSCVSVRICLGCRNNGDVCTFDEATLEQVDEANSTTWDDVSINTRTWSQIFQLSDGPKIEVFCNYGVSAITESTVQKLEILSAKVVGRYFQVEIDITDPSSEINALLGAFTIKYCQM